MKTLINERDMDRMEVEAELLVDKMEDDFIKAFRGKRGKKVKKGKEAVGGERTRLLE